MIGNAKIGKKMEFVVRIGLGRLFFKYFLERGMVVNGFFWGVGIGRS